MSPPPSGVPPLPESQLPHLWQENPRSSYHIALQTGRKPLEQCSGEEWAMVVILPVLRMSLPATPTPPHTHTRGTPCHGPDFLGRSRLGT